MDAESLAQSAVERLLEDETLRGDLTDEGFNPLITWASNALIAAAQQLADKPEAGAEAAMDRAADDVKRVLLGVVQAAQSHARRDVLALARDPLIARKFTACLRLSTSALRLGQDADQNAIRLTRALQGVHP